MTSTVRILDGGMSRELIRLGARLVQPEWSALALMETPEIVRQVHAEFIDAGADVITTNSYALVPFHIGDARFRADGASLIALSGQLAREAADAETGRKVLVGGGLPPIFGSYEPDNFDPARVQDYLSVLVENLAPHVDIWQAETLSLIAEAEAVRVATEATGKPLWVSFTLADGTAAASGGEPALRSGETVTAAAEWAARSGIETLLFNCSKPEVMEPAIRTAAAVFARLGVKIAIGVYANAFEEETAGEKANEGLSGMREELAGDGYLTYARGWVEAGATLVGGCCGIGADQISRLAADLKA
ncbi:homocysteine/selenocysteine methylase (S-methylmethionine-dependent) [Hoeflea sp. IMCC20628]|uniref:homocysteine S-methyltransferase family protein n=1 Tax=Hoeflea sp. IMCC20628 TaxID=1620421 RepID=UPI00063A9C00|nr:homocysteine S-methyltransferase family protein [Hoeflea sp. IMCC20628]AKH99894.1 homocysteine/selenocysteine methylase (S-methylmethionine-dependent) [Hoeflea sp. IMCC20628]